ncbi:MAG TPA: right-handed parallel beta-helix repeat-containing protein, partial [Candidatus Sulfotelmatobacter sp.]|nr:right-handed parallel beta-helix repeat-containing protein [Candidatus Sulfotelmatobacter sp.]
LNPPVGHPPGAFGVKTYCLWNLKEGMTQPGQWYFDRRRNRIVYWPLPGEDMARAETIVPTQRVILKVDGATNVTLRNLELSVTTVPLITGGFAAGAFDGAIQLANARGIRIDGVRVRNVAGHGLKTAGRANNLEVANCELSNCGAGGVYVHGSSNTVYNCLIHDVGLMFPSAMGINGGGEHSLLAHNEIHDTPYSAIDFGAKNSVIASNLIHHCMKVLHDGAGIYVFGARNSSICGNFIRDIVDTGGYGASAYYLDETTRDCVVEHNVSLNVARPSHNHMATNNIIRHNVFITHGDMKLTFPRSTGFALEENVLYANGAITFEGIDKVATWSRNLLYSGKGSIQGVALKDYSQSGRVSGVCGDTQVGDPLFVAPDKFDFRYRPASPAVKLGLQPLDVSQAGRQKRSSAE